MRGADSKRGEGPLPIGCEGLPRANIPLRPTSSWLSRVSSPPSPPLLGGDAWPAPQVPRTCSSLWPTSSWLSESCWSGSPRLRPTFEESLVMLTEQSTCFVSAGRGRKGRGGTSCAQPSSWFPSPNGSAGSQPLGCEPCWTAAPDINIIP